MNELRKQLKPIGAKMMMVKTSLAKLAAENTSFESLIPLFSGPCNLVVSDSPVELAKIVSKYCKDHPNDFVLMGGCYDGISLNQSLIATLLEMESDEKMRLEANMRQLANIMQGPTMTLYQSLDLNSKKWLGLLQFRDMLKEKEMKEMKEEKKD